MAQYDFHLHGKYLVIELDIFVQFMNEIMEKSNLDLVNETLPDGGNRISIERISKERIHVL